MAFSPASATDGHIALGLALRKLSVSGTFMQAPAHPDDETNALFALFGYGMGLRVIDLQNNRGDGGQNEIGPELFRDIAVLRTSELLAAHRIDGCRAIFPHGLSITVIRFDPEEVIAKWGRKEIVGDYVRLIRTLRPDVTVTMNIQGSGGDRAHEATTVLFQEAFREAGDPSMYPEQIREDGLRPWQPKKLYFPGGRGAIPARVVERAVRDERAEARPERRAEMDGVGAAAVRSRRRAQQRRPRVHPSRLLRRRCTIRFSAGTYADMRGRRAQLSQMPGR